MYCAGRFRRARAGEMVVMGQLGGRRTQASCCTARRQSRASRSPASTACCYEMSRAESHTNVQLRFFSYLDGAADNGRLAGRVISSRSAYVVADPVLERRIPRPVRRHSKYPALFFSSQTAPSIRDHKKSSGSIGTEKPTLTRSMITIVLNPLISGFS